MADVYALVTQLLDEVIDRRLEQSRACTSCLVTFAMEDHPND